MDESMETEAVETVEVPTVPEHLEGVKALSIGPTEQKVLEAIESLDPDAKKNVDRPTARGISNRTGIEISHIRMVLRRLLEKDAIGYNEDVATRSKVYFVTDEAKLGVERAAVDRAIRAAKKASKGAPVEPMDPELFTAAVFAVGRFDRLITRWSGQAHRDKVQAETDTDTKGMSKEDAAKAVAAALPVYGVLIDGVEFVGTAQEVVTELRGRRLAITRQPSYVASCTADDASFFQVTSGVTSDDDSDGEDDGEDAETETTEEPTESNETEQVGDDGDDQDGDVEPSEEEAEAPAKEEPKVRDDLEERIQREAARAKAKRDAAKAEGGADAAPRRLRRPRRSE